MRVRGLVVVLLGVCAFLALYAAGQASEDEGSDSRLTAPEVIGAEIDDAAPPRLEPSGSLPDLKPREAPAPVVAPVPLAPAAPVAPAPAPVAPAPPAPAPPPPSNVGQPFYDDR